MKQFDDPELHEILSQKSGILQNGGGGVSMDRIKISAI